MKLHFPTLFQWRQIFKILKKSEKIKLAIFFLLFLFSGIYLSIRFYYTHTQESPSYEGVFKEGVVGQPRFINPIYGETNDIDRSLIELIYSGLMKYDENGLLIPDLIKDYTISEDGKTYTFELKDEIYWHDGAPLTSDDVVFTVKTIQNPEFRSPLRAAWLDVEVQKISDKSFAFLLRTPYSSFLENTTLKILPQHIWKDILPENFSFSIYNLQPIGSGPYMFSSLEQDPTGFIKTITLKVNNRYHNKTPYISILSFSFFKDTLDLIKSACQKKIDGFSLKPMDNQLFTQNCSSAKESFAVYYLSMPRYFAVFFNTHKSKIFSDKNITQALNYGINKDELIKKLNQEAREEKFTVVNSPLLPKYFNFNAGTTFYIFNLEKSKELLEKAGYKEQEDGKRAKQITKKPAFQFKSYLRKGSKGTEVTELQGCLIRLDSAFKEILEKGITGNYDKKTEEAVTLFQKKYLPELKSTGEVGPSTRKKLNELCFSQGPTQSPLRFILTTLDQPHLIKTAEILQQEWEKLGATVEVKVLTLSELKNVIKNRDYDALLHGQMLSTLPDPYPFWHSNQINDPGLNFSLYQNKTVDQLIKEIREQLNEQTRKQKYEKLQEIIIGDAPALFLYNIDYLYWLSKKVKGMSTIKIVDPSKRFSNITNWYIKTHRAWKK